MDFRLARTFTLLGCLVGGVAFVSAQQPAQQPAGQPAGRSGQSQSQGQPQGSSASQSQSKSATAGTDSKFIMTAYQAGEHEIELSKLAEDKAQDKQVQSLATKIRTDHQNANRQLESMAQKKQVTLPKSEAADHKAKMTKFDKLSGASFDREYVNSMVAAHQKAIALFTNASKGTDADVRAFAEKTLPTIREHLRMAQELQKGAGAAQGTAKPNPGSQGATKPAGASQGAASPSGRGRQQ